MLFDRRGRDTRRLSEAGASRLRPGRALSLVIIALALIIAGALPKKTSTTTHKKGAKDATSASASASALVESSAELGDAGAPAASSAPPAMSASASASALPVASAPPPAPAPVASASKPPKPAPSGSADAGSDVRLHDVPVFTIRVGHAGQSASARAKKASDALDQAKDVDPNKVRVEQEPNVAVVYADKFAIVQLFPEDATAAGDASLEIHSNAIATRIQNAINDEQKRRDIAQTVLRVCAVIFAALLALWLLKKIGELSRKARDWLDTNPERFSALRLRTFEVVGASALRGAIGFALSFGKWFLQIGVVYVYFWFAFSLFAATRGYSERLTGFVFTPLSDFTSRVASSIPGLVVLLVATVAVVVAVRFVRLFFGAIGRGEAHVDWLPADLAEPTSVLLRIGIVLGAVVFAAPVVTGETQGTLARVGTIALVAVAVASVPMLASALVGISVVYLRRLRPGEYAEFGGRSGRVLDVGLLEVRIEDADGCEVRVPQLLGLLHPTRVLGATLRISVDVSVVATAPIDQVQAILLQAAGTIGSWSKVELAGIDADGAHFRVSAAVPTPNARAELLAASAKALQTAKIALGRTRAAGG